MLTRVDQFSDCVPRKTLSEDPALYPLIAGDSVESIHHPTPHWTELAQALVLAGATSTNRLRTFSNTAHWNLRDSETSNGDFSLQLIIDTISAGAAVLDGDGRIILVNSVWWEMSRTACWPDIDDSLPEIGIFAGDQAEGNGLLQRSLRKLLAGEWREMEVPFSRTSGRDVRQYRMRALILSHGFEQRLLVINEDVTEADKVSHQGWLISQLLIEAEERERRRLAREIHDTTAQDLIAIGLDVRRAWNLTRDREMRDVLGEIWSMLKRTQASIRASSFLKHPPLMDGRSLAVELDALVKGLAHRMDAIIVLETNVVRKYAWEIEQALFRIVQEALTNVHRHAEANRVVVRYRSTRRRLIVEVEDDGIGFDSKRMMNAGVGIPGMMSRLREVGGELTMARCAPGTLIRATVPLPHEARRGEPSHRGMELAA